MLDLTGGIVGRYGLPEHGGRNSLQLCVDLGQRPARFDASHGAQPPGEAVREAVVLRVEKRVGAKRHRDIESTADFQAEETGGGDTHDLKWLPIKGKGA